MQLSLILPVEGWRFIVSCSISACFQFKPIKYPEKIPLNHHKMKWWWISSNLGMRLAACLSGSEGSRFSVISGVFFNLFLAGCVSAGMGQTENRRWQCVEWCRPSSPEFGQLLETNKDPHFQLFSRKRWPCHFLWNSIFCKAFMSSVFFWASLQDPPVPATKQKEDELLELQGQGFWNVLEPLRLPRTTRYTASIHLKLARHHQEVGLQYLCLWKTCKL